MLAQVKEEHSAYNVVEGSHINVPFKMTALLHTLERKVWAHLLFLTSDLLTRTAVPPWPRSVPTVWDSQPGPTSKEEPQALVPQCLFPCTLLTAFSVSECPHLNTTQFYLFLFYQAKTLNMC